jgi:hypothetical protein
MDVVRRTNPYLHGNVLVSSLLCWFLRLPSGHIASALASWDQEKSWVRQRGMRRILVMPFAYPVVRMLGVFRVAFASATCQPARDKRVPSAMRCPGHRCSHLFLAVKLFLWTCYRYFLFDLIVEIDIVLCWPKEACTSVP